jgi:putative endonuclease
MGNPRHDLGLDAEAAVAAWLTDAGWRVLARRWRVADGELDLVCLDPDETLVGVEVRARGSPRAGVPEESVDRRRISRLRAALARYARRSGMTARRLRIDLVSVSAEREPAARWRLRRLPAIDAW